jgi:hypothetical protein
MTINELHEYAISLGIGIGCAKENKDLVHAIAFGVITTKDQIHTFRAF